MKVLYISVSDLVSWFNGISSKGEWAQCSAASFHGKLLSGTVLDLTDGYTLIYTRGSINIASHQRVFKLATNFETNGTRMKLFIVLKQSVGGDDLSGTSGVHLVSSP